MLRETFRDEANALLAVNIDSMLIVDSYAYVMRMRRLLQAILEED